MIHRMAGQVFHNATFHHRHQTTKNDSLGEAPFIDKIFVRRQVFISDAEPLRSVSRRHISKTLLSIFDAE